VASFTLITFCHLRPTSAGRQNECSWFLYKRSRVPETFSPSDITPSRGQRTPFSTFCRQSHCHLSLLPHTPSPPPLHTFPWSTNPVFYIFLPPTPSPPPAPHLPVVGLHFAVKASVPWRRTIRLTTEVALGFVLEVRVLLSTLQAARLRVHLPCLRERLLGEAHSARGTRRRHHPVLARWVLAVVRLAPLIPVCMCVCVCVCVYICIYMCVCCVYVSPFFAQLVVLLLLRLLEARALVVQAPRLPQENKKSQSQCPSILLL
jgi:hypothetical protein